MSPCAPSCITAQALAGWVWAPEGGGPPGPQLTFMDMANRGQPCLSFCPGSPLIVRKKSHVCVGNV